MLSIRYINTRITVSEAHYDDTHEPQSSSPRQTGSSCLIGVKTHPTIHHTYIKLHAKFQSNVISRSWEICDGNVNSHEDHYIPPASGGV